MRCVRSNLFGEAYDPCRRAVTALRLLFRLTAVNSEAMVMALFLDQLSRTTMMSVVVVMMWRVAASDDGCGVSRLQLNQMPTRPQKALVIVNPVFTKLEATPFIGPSTYAAVGRVACLAGLDGWRSGSVRYRDASARPGRSRHSVGAGLVRNKTVVDSVKPTTDRPKPRSCLSSG